MNGKKWMATLMLACIAAIPTVAQDDGKAPEKPGVNLSLWKGVSTQDLNSTNGTWLNLGLLSAQNSLNGVGVNLLGGITENRVTGLQLATLANVVGGSMRGAQAALLGNVNGDGFQGFSLAGLVGVMGDQGAGLMLSGLAGVSGNSMQGVMASGLVGIAGNRLQGIQLSALASIAGNSFSGIQLNGLLGIAGNRLQGLQISALSNIVGGTLSGAQVGLFNVVSHSRGLQVGLLNYAGDKDGGTQIGIINATPQTQIELVTTAGTSTPVSVGARFKNPHTYTVVAVGLGYQQLYRTNMTLTYRAGLWRKVWRELSVTGDAGIQLIETFHRNTPREPGHLYNLQGRLGAEWQLTDKTGLQAFLGYEHSHRWGSGGKFHQGLFAEVGTCISLGRFTR